MSTLVSSPAGFAPRKEFVKSQSTTHQFALLTFNGADVLRLSNFPPRVIQSLRTLYETRRVFKAIRQDNEMGVTEFVFGDKLWAGKSIKTERMATLTFCTILSHQFKYVTDIAYGRISQDTKSLVFLKPVPPSKDSNGQNQASSSTAAISPSPLPPLEQRTCFSLSLTKDTLRVICAPKSCTPAILASVRSAWPRGIVSEGRPEDDIYEFQLKGYGLFSTSTFDRDALVHIFSLLRALDAHSLHLITNLELTSGISKSRTKDLWIFDAPSDTLSPVDTGERSSVLPVPSYPNPGDRMVSVATSAGVAGVGTGYNAFITSTEGYQAAQHARAATAPGPGPSPLSKEKSREKDHARNGSSDSEGYVAISPGGPSAIIGGHAKSASSPEPDRGASPTSSKAAVVGRGHSVLRKPPPTTPEKGRRKNSLETATPPLSSDDHGTSVGHGTMTSQGGSGFGTMTTQGTMTSRRGLGATAVNVPPTLQSGGSYSSQGGTNGPLTESEYAYGYGTYDAPAVPSKPAGTYQPYTPPVIYSSSSANPPPPPPRPETEALLSGDAFRETSYSGTTESNEDGSGSKAVPIAYTGNGPESPTEETEEMETPKRAHAPLPQQPEMVAGPGKVYSPVEGRPKSEKAFLGIIAPPSPPPLPTGPPISYSGVQQPGMDRMNSTASSVLPPGGYPKTPQTSGLPEGAKLVAGAVAAEEAGSGQASGKRQSPQKLIQRTSSEKRVPPTGEVASPGKGWVLVNVEQGRKTSMDGATAAMDAAAAQGSRSRTQTQRSKLSTVEQPLVSNVRINDPTNEATFTSSPIAMVQTEDPVRKGSLKKKKQSTATTTGTSSSGDSDRRFLGLFHLGHKKKKPSVDDKTFTTDSAASQATNGVQESESSWKRRKEPPAPRKATQMTIA